LANDEQEIVDIHTAGLVDVAEALALIRNTIAIHIFARAVSNIT
jgi:hypothetical protein